MNLQGAEPVDVGTLIVAAAALVLSLFAVAYSKRSADAARESVRRERERAESRHVRWEITGGWSGNEVGYELLNRGSSTAHHVRLFLPPGSGGLTIHRRGGLDVPGGASVSFTIRGPVSAADISDVTDTVGNVPEYALGSVVDGRRRLGRKELPKTVLVDCAERDQAEQLRLPRPRRPRP